MITIDSNAPGSPLKMPWRYCIAVGRAYELLRKDLLDHLQILQLEIGYRYCRFHGIFHDDVSVAIRRPDGKLQYRWHHVDKIYDSLLALGLRPFVELNSMPAALASGEQTIFHWKMNVTPPADYDEWGDLVHQFTSHLVDRYGLDEVRQWYFEVWNEPNLSGFWSGTKEDYWKLYDVSVRAVRSVDSQLRVGGPATSKANWITDFIDHCDASGSAVDFVSTHLYPQDEYVQYTDRQGSPHAPGEFFADTIKAVREEIRTSKLPALPIFWTEWNAMSTTSTKGVDWTHNATNDSLFGASFIVKNMLALDDSVDSLTWWVASDLFEEGGMPHSAFSGTYGLLTIHGIGKANFNAFRLLTKLRGNILPVSFDSSIDECGAFATASENACHIVLWNSAALGHLDPPVWRDRLRLSALGLEPHQVIATRIRAGAGSCFETWINMGRPQNLSLTQESLLRAHSVPEHSLQVATPTHDRMIELPVELLPGEVLYLEIRQTGPVAGPKGDRAKDEAKWNQAMSDRSS